MVGLVLSVLVSFVESQSKSEDAKSKRDSTPQLEGFTESDAVIK